MSTQYFCTLCESFLTLENAKIITDWKPGRRTKRTVIISKDGQTHFLLSEKRSAAMWQKLHPPQPEPKAEIRHPEPKPASLTSSVQINSKPSNHPDHVGVMAGGIEINFEE